MKTRSTLAGTVAPAFAISPYVFLAAAMAAVQPLAAQSAEERFDALVAAVDSFDLAHDPIRAGREGNLAALGRLPVVTPEAERRRAATNRRFRERLRTIERSELPEEERLNHDLLAWMLERRVEMAAFDEGRVPFTNDSGFHTLLGYLALQTPTRSSAHAEAWIARMRDYPRFVDEHVANLERGIETGWVQPPVVAERILEAARRQRPATEATESVYFEPLRGLPDAIPGARRSELRDAAGRVIEEAVRPAVERLVAFLEERYLPAARDSLGVRSIPDGEAYYRTLVRHHTTTDLTPEEVHRIGREEVDRVRAEMEAVIESTGFEGSFEAFLSYLRTDDRFYADTPEELLEFASYVAKKADEEMPAFFRTLPRLSYGVRPVPAEIAPDYTTGRYWEGDYENGVAGGYMVNTHDLDARPLYNIPALTLHEAVPGHHHQIALAQEMKGVPGFRRDLSVTAFTEGWGLYAERLGEEMGIYATPYERFGRLSYEMWRACRLVIDTGVHWMGWSRDRAEACLLDNSALSEHNVRTEIDRYISWPGQALAYKIGELKLRELRGRAEEALGEDFDLRAFHDAVLLEGALPLSILEERIARWLEEVRRGG